MRRKAEKKLKIKHLKRMHKEEKLKEKILKINMKLHQKTAMIYPIFAMTVIRIWIHGSKIMKMKFACIALSLDATRNSGSVVGNVVNGVTKNVVEKH